MLPTFVPLLNFSTISSNASCFHSVLVSWLQNMHLVPKHCRRIFGTDADGHELFSEFGGVVDNMVLACLAVRAAV